MSPNSSTLTSISSMAAIALAVMLTVAAVAKLVSRTATIDEFRALGLPIPETLSVAVPIAELATALLLLTRPAWGGLAAFGLLSGFTAYLWGVVRSGAVVDCACFGGLGKSQVTWRTLVRNVGLLALAALAAFNPEQTLAFP